MNQNIIAPKLFEGLKYIEKKRKGENKIKFKLLWI